MTDVQGTEPPAAKRQPESPAGTESWMEAVCNRENLWKALKRVQANKGSAGVDGMTVKQLPGYLAKHWPVIREQLLQGTYQPQPVKRVEIPKPDGGVWRYPSRTAGGSEGPVPVQTEGARVDASDARDQRKDDG